MSSHEEASNIEEFIAEVMQSKKYRGMNICEDTLTDLIVTELKHHKRKKDAFKAARKKLHLITATCLGDPDYNVATKELEDAFRYNDPDMLKDACAHIMSTHASSRERLSILDDLYTYIFEITGTPTAILDIACGLNPLSFPWMGLPNSTHYHAYDIHEQRVKFLNRYFSLQGLLPLAKVQDILVHFPEEKADVAFIFKEVHRFERP